MFLFHKTFFSFKSSSHFDMEAICVDCVPKTARSEINYWRKLLLVVQCTMYKVSIEVEFQFSRQLGQSWKSEPENNENQMICIKEYIVCALYVGCGLVGVVYCLFTAVNSLNWPKRRTRRRRGQTKRGGGGVGA